ncbi:Hypothetical protein NTJ_08024 [Nesidiocoris tenuis]|nr:Hypothetical protein NTJ_08024 [Nesidiocoris tenuis]
MDCQHLPYDSKCSISDGSVRLEILRGGRWMIIRLGSSTRNDGGLSRPLHQRHRSAGRSAYYSHCTPINTPPNTDTKGKSTIFTVGIITIHSRRKAVTFPSNRIWSNSELKSEPNAALEANNSIEIGFLPHNVKA